MFKYLLSLFSVLMMGTAFAFGSIITPYRQDKLDDTSKSAQVKLARAEQILSTLVPDPQSYHLILSSFSTIGAEAVPPNVYSDKPTMIVYQGTLAPDRSKEEVAFVMAHELGHLNLHHGEKMGERMEKLFNSHPIEVSGTSFTIFYQKLQEREADLYGLDLYKKAGYDLGFFSYTLNLLKINTNIHFGSTHVFQTPLPSLSSQDSHFSMLERFQLLAHLTAL